MTDYVLEVLNVFYGFTARELYHISYNCSETSLSRHILKKKSHNELSC